MKLEMLSALNTGCLYSPGPEYGRKDYINEKLPSTCRLVARCFHQLRNRVQHIKSYKNELVR